MVAFVELDLVCFSLLSQEIGWEERLQDNLWLPESN